MLRQIRLRAKVRRVELRLPRSLRAAKALPTSKLYTGKQLHPTHAMELLKPKTDYERVGLLKYDYAVSLRVNHAENSEDVIAGLAFRSMNKIAQVGSFRTFRSVLNLGTHEMES